MANVLVNDTSLTAIGNAIREKNGETTLYKPAEMATAIQALATGGGGGELKTVAVYQGNITYSRNNTEFTIQNDNFPDTGVEFTLIIATGSSVPILITKYDGNKFDAPMVYGNLYPRTYNGNTHTLKYEYMVNNSLQLSARPTVIISFIG